MSSTEIRNQKVKAILTALYEQAEDTHYIINEAPYKDYMDKLFMTTAWGFREIVLVVIVAMKLDSSYRASTGFYACNPRAIYEGPIKEFLIEKDIPHRKSGPLNVAKATVGLDMNWAAQRRPFDAAEVVVHIIEYLETFNKAEDRINWVGVSLLRRLIASAEILATFDIELIPNENPDHLYRLCYELITKTPDGGNTPQKISAFLLKNYHANYHTEIVVTGGEDRAFVTSTTSKKPGDINEEYSNKIYKVYEVTVKQFNISRIQDSFDCVSIYNTSHNTNINEVIVICRKEDCPHGMVASGLKCCLGNFRYQNIIYYFWDIFEWIASTLQHMTAEGRQAFYCSLNDYIKEINTSVSVKQLWQQLHQN